MNKIQELTKVIDEVNGDKNIINEANEKTLKLLKQAIDIFVTENKGKGIIGTKVSKFTKKDINDITKELFKHLILYIDKKY